MKHIVAPLALATLCLFGAASLAMAQTTTVTPPTVAPQTVAPPAGAAGGVVTPTPPTPQNAPPLPGAPGGAAHPVVAPATTAPALTTAGRCMAPRPAGTPLVLLTLEEIWQPRGGNLGFTLMQPPNTNTAKGFAADDRVIVCFRWRTSETSNSAALEQSHFDRWSTLVRLAKIGTDGSISLQAEVPADMPEAPDRGIKTGLHIVPVTDMRVIVIAPDQTVLADETAEVGITNIWVSIGLALACGVLLIVALALIKKGMTGPRSGNPILRIISTKWGGASLSQFQVLLWTLVVSLSVIYVMSLSGTLIDISDGTLVLLGISGGVTLVSRIQSASPSNASSPPDEFEQQASPPNGSANWSDLVVANGEIDVSRLQMLTFTLVVAFFVGIKVVTGYAIPDIPTNILLLMGISNGVYLGAKYANTSKGVSNSSPPGNS